MSKISDQTYLLTNQYQNASNLNARMQLHARFSVNQSGWHLWVFDHFRLDPQSRVLELGCGPGSLWVENLNRIPPGWDITLSDFSEGMLQIAQKDLENSRRRFLFDVIDAQSIPADKQSFDAVIANHMFYHVPDISQALSEIHRVLKPGGRLYASTVGLTHMQELDKLLRKFDPKIETLFDGDQPHSFILENGAEILSQWFTDVTLWKYDDALVITEVEPLVAYVMSMIRFTLDKDRLAEFTNFVAQEMVSAGAIHVTKASGLFEAVKG
ncbi:MAG: methyltransferase domain-containing protein [Anaerolineae bacterium]|nr:methyltransferase domain-containing protein [Anaerolineae bacterium]